MSNQEQKTNGIEVMLGLLNGDEHKGLLVHYDPSIQLFALQVSDSELKYFNAPDVAYVGFYRPEGRLVAVPNLDALEEMIIHMVTGAQFEVQMVKSRVHENGFFAFMADKDSPFERFFFYNHGVRSLEHPKPIGQTLIDEKGVPPHKVRKALDRQKLLHEQQIGEILVKKKKVDPLDIDQAIFSQGKKYKQIGEILIETGLISDDDLHQALVEQSTNRTLKIGQVMINMGLVTEEELMSALAKKFNMPFVDLDDFIINPKLVEQFDINMLLRFQVIPITSTDDTLTVASSDPMNFEAFDAIRFQTAKRIVEVLAAPTQLQKTIEKEISIQTDGENEWLSIEKVAGDTEDGIKSEILEVKAAEAAPIVRLVNKVLINALNKGASDIHVLPQAKELSLLYRINGDLKQEMTLEKWVQRRMVSRIKLLSGMNIADHRVTQDGRMLVRHDGRVVELRVSCIPNAHGESIVMRILDKEMAVGMQSLGLREKDRNSLARMLRKPHGLILSTGPTGSGKSTTLYALLQNIVDLPLHIITIEDPVESEIAKANQIQVNTKVGLTFASILRNVLRHDPDVIMVGEMRDTETASIGIEASLTGHLMLSTLHTNSAVDTIIRLQDLGIPKYLLAPALRGIISQSLVKRLCDHCRQSLDDEHDEVYQILEDKRLERPKSLYKPGKCEACDQTGFSGRVMAYEFLEVTDTVRQAIHAGKIGRELQTLAEEEGMVAKARHALELAENGIICRDDLIQLLI